MHKQMYDPSHLKALLICQQTLVHLDNCAYKQIPSSVCFNAILSMERHHLAYKVRAASKFLLEVQSFRLLNNASHEASSDPVKICDVTLILLGRKQTKKE